MIRVLAALTLVSLTLTSPALGAPSPEEKCQQALSLAAGKYLLCMQTAIGKFEGGALIGVKLWSSAGKCVTSYTQGWSKLAAKYAGQGTSCEGSRYADNGDGTFYDRLTRLTWEKKDDGGGIHDKDDVYTWSTGDPWKETGGAFTDRKSTRLNSSHRT